MDAASESDSGAQVRFPVLTTGLPSSLLFERWLRVLALERSVFNSIANDPRARWQALITVALVGIATGVGVLDDSGVAIVAPTVISSLVGWAVWSFLIYVTVTKMPNGVLNNRQTPEIGGIAKVVAFAQLPALLRVVGLFSSVGPMIAVLTFVWIIITMTIAVNQAFQLESPFRSFAVVVTTFVPYLMLVGLFTLLTVN